MNLSIDTITIRQDEHGRYSLNDLYQASGGSRHHRPSKWLANDRTKELIDAILRRNSAPAARVFLGPKSGPEYDAVLSRNSGPETSRVLSTNSCSENDYAKFQVRAIDPVFTERMGNPGTWVARPLVFAYAMWVNADFHLRVIETFDAATTDDFVKPNIQAENFWFALRPHWKPIRDMAASGMLYRDIAAAVGRSVRSVAHCVQRMIEVGLMNPTQRVLARFKPDTAQRMINQNQLCLNWGVRA